MAIMTTWCEERLNLCHDKDSKVHKRMHRRHNWTNGGHLMIHQRQRTIQFVYNVGRD